MAKFKAVPQPRSEESFVNGADAPRSVHALGAPDFAASRETSTGRPWDGLDPKAPPTVNQTVRLNAYQHAQLQYIAQLEERSQAQVLRRLLVPILGDAALAAHSGS